ncbi:hypothetical protein HW555_004434 [Spodoptera exigua]|uniref:Uncharacterized protein n=1 Tax=Spodoptera exigua TaxID=7107 RepID=A0A835L684_SPOEX|nr:hypothetical protein HW555_004434 [Spodoptera exigua]
MVKLLKDDLTSAPVDPGSTSSKVPVYMDDLKKALDDLENKLKSMTTTVGTVTGTTAKGGPWWNGGNDGAVHNGLQTPVRSIDNIIGILKKAIHIEHRDPKPSENLEWIQVKIPKTGK